MIDMKDFKITVYETVNTQMCLGISDDELWIKSNVYGDYDSEKLYNISKDNTAMLFTIISLDDFIEKLKDGGCMFFESFMEENKIEFSASMAW